MLTRLQVDSFALIDRVDLELGPGLTVLTGETGAGKSILIGALQSILGAQVSADLVRQGAEHCQVEGRFAFPADDPACRRLAAAGFGLAEGQLVLRREIRAGGRSRAYVNGSLVPVRRLREAGRLLVDLHGQHEHQSLLDPEQHARFLDACAGLGAAADAVAATHAEVQAAAAGLRRLEAERERLRAEEELRRYQLEEIRRIAPTPDEDEHLEREVSVLANQETLVRGAQGLHEALYSGDDSAVERLGHARRALAHLVELDPSLGAQLEALNQLVYGLEDLATGLRDYAAGLEADPEGLEVARERLEELRRLVRRHGAGLDRILERAAELASQDERSAQLDRDVAAAQAQHGRARAQFTAACARLSADRGRAGAELAAAVETGLADLGMAAATFRAQLVPRPEPDAAGAESVAFHVSANRGERPLPLARVASGGELSRIMLVLKQIIAERDAVSTVVFDEVDAGISGRVAAAVGRRLAALSRARQTLVITHLPQIASEADRHFSVRKGECGGRMVTHVVELAGDARAEEIASLLAGDTVSETARRHAQELLKSGG